MTNSGKMTDDLNPKRYDMVISKEIQNLYVGDVFYYQGLKYRTLIQRDKDLEREMVRCYCPKTRKQLLIPWGAIIEQDSLEFPSTGIED